MVPRILQRLFRAVLGGFLIGSSLIGSAQDDSTIGVVRITDSRPRGVPLHNAGFKSSGNFSPAGDAYCDGCPGGIGGCPHCNGGGCPHCFGGHCFGGHCFGGHCMHSKLGQCLACKFREHYCCDGSDHGYSPPGKTPIWRRGVQYNQYYPAGWYGTPNGGIAPGVVYPQVYVPTDTTQLGFYYQHVPFWHPHPYALPPRPIPAQWHVYGAGWGGASLPAGHVVNTTTSGPTPLPANGQPSPPAATEPPPTPVPEQEAAPAPTDASRGLPIRRANYEQ